MVDTDKNYVGDEAFWEKYIKGRPPIPESFFQHICKYHATHGGGFGVVHDVGAGVGVHSARLAKYFDHVIVSDVVAENVRLAQQRLGTDKYSYRAAKLEDAGDLEESSVDMIFASFVMHFAHFDEAFAAFAKQLKPGGTFVALICAIPHFADQHVLELWRHIWFEGLRVLLNHAADRNDRLRTLGNVASGYDTMPLPEKYFLPGAQRIALNAGRTSWPPMLPDDLWAEYHSVFGTSTGEWLLVFPQGPLACFTYRRLI